MEMNSQPALHPASESQLPPPPYSAGPTAAAAAELRTSEPPAFYPTGSSAAAYPVQNVMPISGDTAQHTAVNIVSSQPQNNSSSSQTQYYSHSRRGYEPANNRVFKASVCLCITCLLLGSPLTMLCFVPAILLAKKARDWTENEESGKAETANIFAYICNILGIVSGLAIVVVIIVLRIMATSNSGRDTPSN